MRLVLSAHAGRRGREMSEGPGEGLRREMPTEAARSTASVADQKNII
jgi:hypothetical protein